MSTRTNTRERHERVNSEHVSHRQGNLTQMVTNLTGTTTSGSITSTGVPSIAKSPLTSVCSPLGVQLPQTMRAKLVNSEFAKFGQLLEKLSTSGARMIRNFPWLWCKGEISVT